MNAKIEVCRLGLGETTEDGPYYAKVNGDNVGIKGRTHWHTIEEAREAGISFADQLEAQIHAQRKINADAYYIESGVNTLCRLAHTNSKVAGWWNDLEGLPLLSNSEYAGYVVATKLHLMVTEIVEATEGYRKDQMDDKLPHRSMLEVELADTMIRIADLAGALNLDLAGAIIEKMAFNTTRPDHQVINRRKPGGKKF